MSDKRKSSPLNPTSALAKPPPPNVARPSHPHRNSPQPQAHTTEFKPIAIKTSSLSITPQKPTSPILSAGPNRRQNPLSATEPSQATSSLANGTFSSDTNKYDKWNHQNDYDESTADDASEVDTAAMEIVTHSMPDDSADDDEDFDGGRGGGATTQAYPTKSTPSIHSDGSSKTLAGLDGGATAKVGKSIADENGWGGGGADTGKKSVLLRYLTWDFSTEVKEPRSSRANRIRKKRIFVRSDPKTYFSNERTTYSWMYLHILTLSFSLSLYAFPQASGNTFPPTHIAATIASGVALILVMTTAVQFRRRQEILARIHNFTEGKSAELFDESVHRFPTIVTLFVVGVLIINVFCIWTVPTYDIKSRSAFSHAHESQAHH